jgi:hypothetical protein
MRQFESAPNCAIQRQLLLLAAVCDDPVRRATTHAAARVAILAGEIRRIPSTDRRKAPAHEREFRLKRLGISAVEGSALPS